MSVGRQADGNFIRRGDSVSLFTVPKILTILESIVLCRMLFQGKNMVKTVADSNTETAGDSQNQAIVMVSSIPSGAIGIHWLIALRWVAVLGQLLVVLVVNYLFDVPLELFPLLTAIGVTALSNLLLTVWFFRNRDLLKERERSRLWSALFTVVMGVDLLLLTVMLYFSGGPGNPFWIFYFVNLCLVGIELSASVAWCLNLLAICCFAFLLYDHHPLQVEVLQDYLPAIRKTGIITLAHSGALCSFMTCASVVIFFSTFITGKLRTREILIRDLEAKRIRGEKLEALGTLAAGAAHELSTPLGSIAIIAGEIQHGLSVSQSQQNEANHSHLLEDIALIRSELDRCRFILNHMSAQAGEETIEKKESLTGKELLNLIMKEVKQPSRVITSLSAEAENCRVRVSPYVTAQALRGTIKNALEASPPDANVRVKIDCQNGKLVLTVIDAGNGIPDQILSRIGEPFFTTKRTGKGMGLGVFLARTVVERLGGTMQIDSTKDRGTTVVCRIPCQAE